MPQFFLALMRHLPHLPSWIKKTHKAISQRPDKKNIRRTWVHMAADQ
jgi:hypothetical protein